ncbi:hypothetical protein COEREDRAFT_78883 [Coemansia reversa NRRL 1564]|uniref:DBF4-type domain-containing protein n=1 Tax=Coemansia reversa (strain ATCC 12441 / NRRL 1564) TaxID=763665 RepID=A0A2G5BKM0_COERN|nr:hypothetical protein COEREDRAFT_78883 [Coemansia reversa NRRL 1564]|eukprot:PIA19550.1 hypothetical protein COEREDRAFT_78883 [Coemansia reversa NRRL 1564]
MSSRRLTFNAPRPSTRNLGASPAGRSTLHNSQPHADILSPMRSLATPTRPAQRASSVRLHQNATGLASPLRSPSTVLHSNTQGRRNPLQAITSREQQSNNKASAEAAAHPHTSLSTEQQREQKARLSEWIKAYRRAFPSFVFYFEGIDESSVQRLSVSIHHLGGKVETFFSAQSVTHVIVEHPDMVNSENAENSSHVVLLAKRFGLKIWDVTKLEKRVLGLLLPGYNASNAQGANVQSAKRKLNEAFSTEKMYAMRHKAFEGTSVAHCVDFYHFKYIYVLVEDATHLHRPAIMEDYRPPELGRDPPWPKLYMVPTGRCPFVQYEDPTTSNKGSDTDSEDNKENMTPEPEDTLPTAHLPSKTPVNRIRTPRGAALSPDAGCAVPEDSPSARSLRVSAAVRSLAESQLVTPTRPSRSQVVSGMAAAPIDVVPGARLAATPAIMDSNASGIAQSNGVTSTSTAFHLNAMDPIMQRSLLQNLNGGRVTHLSRLEHPVATASRVAGGTQGPRTHGRAPPIPRTKKARVPVRRSAVARPGYCENCRAKFEDMLEHVATPQHRRFATSERNWVGLDALLDCVRRPLRKPVLATQDSMPNIVYALSSDDASQPGSAELQVALNDGNPANVSLGGSWVSNPSTTANFSAFTSTQLMASGRLSTEAPEAPSVSCAAIPGPHQAGNNVDLTYTNSDSPCASQRDEQGHSTADSATYDEQQDELADRTLLPELIPVTPLPLRATEATSNSIEALVSSLETPRFCNDAWTGSYEDGSTLIGLSAACRSQAGYLVAGENNHDQFATPTRSVGVLSNHRTNHQPNSDDAAVLRPKHHGLDINTAATAVTDDEGAGGTTLVQPIRAKPRMYANDENNAPLSSANKLNAANRLLRMLHGDTEAI